MRAIRLRIARPMCDGCTFASWPFCRLAGRRLFFLCDVPFWWLLQVAFYLCRRQTLHDHVPRDREITQTQCSRPYGTASCYLHTAIWLGKCQSILTQVEHSGDPQLVCHRIPSAPRLAGPRELCPLIGRQINQEDTFSLGTHLCMKMQE